MVSITVDFTASEKASPLMLFAYKPDSTAASSKATVLYQPALAGFPFDGGLSKKTPKVSAPQEKAAVTRDDKP